MSSGRSRSGVRSTTCCAIRCQRSRRKRPPSTAARRSRLVAQTTRTSTRRSRTSPTRRDRSLLQHAEELHLNGRREVCDLVEEERAAVGGFEEAGAVERAAEGPGDTPEELALDEALGDGAAVDGDEGAVAQRALVVAAREAFLARPRGAQEDEAQAAPRRLAHRVVGSARCRRAEHEVGLLVALLVAQRVLLLDEAGHGGEVIGEADVVRARARRDDEALARGQLEPAVPARCARGRDKRGVGVYLRASKPARDVFEQGGAEVRGRRPHRPLWEGGAGRRLPRPRADFEENGARFVANGGSVAALEVEHPGAGRAGHHQHVVGGHERRGDAHDARRPVDGAGGKASQVGRAAEERGLPRLEVEGEAPLHAVHTKLHPDHGQGGYTIPATRAVAEGARLPTVVGGGLPTIVGDVPRRGVGQARESTSARAPRRVGTAAAQ
jgi:hypothetical protein